MACSESPRCPPDCPECKWVLISETYFSEETGKELLDEAGFAEAIKLQLVLRDL